MTTNSIANEQVTVNRLKEGAIAVTFMVLKVVLLGLVPALIFGQL